MKKIIIAMAAIAAAFTMASCNKEPLVEPENNPTEGNCILIASTENNLTKTSLEGDDEKGYEVVWSKGDTFKFPTGEVFTLTAGENTNKGIFSGDAELIDGQQYVAYYPSDYNGSIWPTTQTYVENNISGNPMRGFFTFSAGEDSSISFTNVGGILRLTVKGEAFIKNVIVSAAELNHSIILDCNKNGSGVELDAKNGTVFHVAMPKRAEGYSGVSIRLTAIDGTVCTKNLGSGKKLIINRSEITPASFTATDFQPLTSINGHAYVELAGCKWATENVGLADAVTPAAIDPDYGYYYSAKRDDIFSDALAAARSWGSTWTLPTKEQLESLKNNCYWEWTTNYDGTGKAGCIVYMAKDEEDKGKMGRPIDNYSSSDVHIFLPASGYFNDTENKVQNKGELGRYASSNGVNYLYIGDGSKSIYNYPGSWIYGYSVRPVSEY